MSRSRKNRFLTALTLTAALMAVPGLGAASALPTARGRAGLAGIEGPASFVSAAWQWLSERWLDAARSSGPGALKAVWANSGSCVDPEGGKCLAGTSGSAGAADNGSIVDPNGGKR